MMPATRIAPPAVADLGISYNRRPGYIVVVFDRALTTPDLQDRLNQLFQYVDQSCMRLGLDAILDVRAVDYATTALWKCLVRWLQDMRKDNVAFRIHLRVDRSWHWQDVAVSTLSAFGGRHLIIEDAEAPRT